MAAPVYTHTLVTNLGPRRRVPYIPPAGQVMDHDEVLTVGGLLEVLLVMGDRRLWKEFVADEAKGWVALTYDFGAATVVIPDPGRTGLYPGDQDLFAAPSAGSDGADTGVAISVLPASNSLVEIHVNGVRCALGDGAKDRAFYFSGDGGTTPKPIASILPGDELYFNPTVAGWDLEVTDRISLIYVTATIP